MNEYHNQLTVPVMDKIGSDWYQLKWTEGVTITLTSFEESRGYTSAEMEVWDTIEPNPYLYGPERFTLNSRLTALSDAIEEDSSRTNWYRRLKQTRKLVLDDYRKQAKIVRLGDLPRPDTVDFLVHPILTHGGANVLYGPAGIGKSYLSLFLGHMVQNGLSNIVGLGRAESGKVLYIDYETNESLNYIRSQDILDGLDLWPNDDAGEAMISYWRAKSAIRYNVRGLQQEIAKNDIRLVIVDSAGPAVGGSPEDADITLKYFEALGDLTSSDKPLTTLTIAHVAKNSTAGSSSPYGSVYWVNQPRSTWELKKNEEQYGKDQMDITLIHQKSNNGQIQPNINLNISFNDGVRFRNIADLKEERW